ncbi:MAG: branched-chain amino acid ABC transporter permease [Bacteroidota bacterium]
MAPKQFLKYSIGILLGLGLLSLPLFGSAASIRLVELVLIYSIAGMGLQLLTGQAGLISLGQAGFMAIGAYTTAYLLQLGWPLALAIPLAVLLSGLVGILLAIPANRLSGPYLAIVSLAFGIGISSWISHTNWLGASSGMRVLTPQQLPETGLYFMIVIISFVAYIGASVLRSSKWGLIWQGIREQEILIAHLGIKAAYYKSWAFVICAAFAGLAGALWALYLTYLSPTSFGFTLSISLLAGIVLGGLYKLEGAILGIALLSLLKQNLLPTDLSSLGWVLEGAILMLFMLALPQRLWQIIQTKWL